jgi:hypothetical protein
MASIANTPSNEFDESPQALASAGVSFPLARWYCLIGRRLNRPNDWDIERIMSVRLQLALAKA